MNFTDKNRFVLKLIKVGSGVLGSAMVLNDNHPYFTVAVLVIGAVANEALNYNEKL